MPTAPIDPAKQAKIAKSLKIIRYCWLISLFGALLFVAVASGAVEWVSYELCLLKFALAGWLR